MLPGRGCRDSIFQKLMIIVPSLSKWRKTCLAPLPLFIAFHVPAFAQLKTSQVRTPNGILEGAISADGKVRRVSPLLKFPQSEFLGGAPNRWEVRAILIEHVKIKSVGKLPDTVQNDLG